MELQDYLRALRAHWVGVLVIAVLGLAAASAYNLTQPRVYAADASGFVSTGVSSDPALASVGDSLAKSRAKSYVDLATSRATAAQVIEDLGLEDSPASLIGRISVDQPLDTVSIKIVARAASPQQARRLADGWVAALADQVEAVENPTGEEDVSVPRVVPVEAAALPAAPVSPRVGLNTAIGLALGLLLGLAYALVRTQLDRRLRSSAEIERETGVAVVGSIPAERELAQREGRAPALVDAQGRSTESAEGFRKLRTNLAYMDVDDPPRVIVVTSPHQGDGKSTVAANLAAAVALSGQPVTLVDGDLRRPHVATVFGLVEGAGLTDVLVGRVAVDEVLQEPADLAGLSVLAAGSVPPNPSELLGSKAMRALLQTLAGRGMVIVDAPPLLPVTDAAVLTTHADGALVVISYGRTLDTELGDALGSLAAVSGRTLGVVFNAVPRRNSAGGYYDRYAASDADAAATPVEPARGA